MERVLLRREEHYQEIEMLETQKKLKVKKAKLKEKRFSFQKDSMDKFYFIFNIFYIIRIINGKQ